PLLDLQVEEPPFGRVGGDDEHPHRLEGQLGGGHRPGQRLGQHREVEARAGVGSGLDPTLLHAELAVHHADQLLGGAKAQHRQPVAGLETVVRTRDPIEAPRRILAGTPRPVSRILKCKATRPPRSSDVSSTPMPPRYVRSTEPCRSVRRICSRRRESPMTTFGTSSAALKERSRPFVPASSATIARQLSTVERMSNGCRASSNSPLSMVAASSTSSTMRETCSAPASTIAASSRSSLVSAPVESRPAAPTSALRWLRSWWPMSASSS